MATGGMNSNRKAGGRVATVVAWLAYPVVMATGVGLHFFLRDAGAGLLVATYLPVAVGIVAIVFLERRFPHRGEWQPDAEDWQGDISFMVVVQVLLPKALAFLIAVTALGWLSARGISLAGWWPHRWPVLAQAGLIFLTADFFRYWLHRASHEWSPLLWRFHAVHHSPHKLYWVNVGRVHPVDKALQFLLETAPFLLLGISPEVLSVYFVLYVLNGFFQHSNIELRLGFLNYIIAGPELHRWHHSWEPRESNRNYGNSLIVWDLVFGSYFLPGDRKVEQLGLRNREYPRGFLRQMRTPFIAGAGEAENGRDS